MANHIEELRKKYIKSPPEGLTADDIKSMSDDDLLDMDYFLHEDDDLNDDIGEEGFYILYNVVAPCLICCPKDG